MRTTATVITGIVLGLLLGADARAQSRFHWQDPKEWGPPGGLRIYDPKTVVTIKGRVLSVERLPAHEGDGDILRLRVQTATELIAVHLGPSWYLDAQPMKLEPQDDIEVKGSRVALRHKAEVIAAEVRKGKATMVLRDEKGVTAWAGFKQR